MSFPRYKLGNLQSLEDRVSNLDAVFEKIDGTARSCVASMRAVGEQLPSTYFKAARGVPTLEEMVAYLQCMTCDAIESALTLDDALEQRHDPRELEKGQSCDDVYQVDAFIDEWYGDVARVHIVIARLY